MFELNKYKKYLKHAKLVVAVLLVILAINVFGVIIANWQFIVIAVAIIFIVGFLIKFFKIIK